MYVLLEELLVVLHFDHLDDPLDECRVGGHPRFDRAFGVADGANGLVEPAAFFFERPALRSQDVGKLTGVLVEHPLDLLQGQADELQGDDLLEALEVRLGVEPVPGRAAPRLQQRQPIVMMERPDGDSRQLGERLHPIRPGHLRSFEDSISAYLTSGSSVATRNLVVIAGRGRAGRVITESHMRKEKGDVCVNHTREREKGRLV